MKNKFELPPCHNCPQNRK